MLKGHTRHSFTQIECYILLLLLMWSITSAREPQTPAPEPQPCSTGQLLLPRLIMAQILKGMLKVTYQISVANWSVNSATDPKTEFVALEINSSLASPGDFCRITIYAPPALQTSLLEQAMSEAGALGSGGGAGQAAFAVQVRGHDIKPGDQLTIELTAGDRTGKVATADVRSIGASLGQTRIEGATGKQKLANTRLNQVYENQTLKQIVSDLASQAGVAAGDLDTGSSYSCLVVHESRNLLNQIGELARRDGLDVYFDQENKLTLKKFNKLSADHTFFYGIDVLDLQMRTHQPVSDHLVVYGESPSSNQGKDTWHWLAKDLSPFRGEVGKGLNTLTIADGALRTKDAAANLATSKFGAIKDHSTRGKLKILGNPQVRLGDAIEIKQAPKPELNGLFKVVSVRHVLNKYAGYLTFIDFSGQGGAATAADLLGQVGQLAGALGL